MGYRPPPLSALPLARVRSSVALSGGGRCPAGSAPGLRWIARGGSETAAAGEAHKTLAPTASPGRSGGRQRRRAAGGGGCRRNAGVVAGDRAGQKAPPPRLDPDTRAGHNGLITASAGSQSNWPASRRCCRQIVTAATPALPLPATSPMALPLYPLPLRWRYLSTGYLSDGVTSLPATSRMALPLHRLLLR